MITCMRCWTIIKPKIAIFLAKSLPQLLCLVLPKCYSIATMHPPFCNIFFYYIGCTKYVFFNVKLLRGSFDQIPKSETIEAFTILLAWLFYMAAKMLLSHFIPILYPEGLVLCKKVVCNEVILKVYTPFISN